ncbi:MAG: heparinase II/III-family protein, partial [Alphaproteobacteria bacterium]
RPPPILFSRGAHAGTLAFEFSAGRQSIVINCGMPAMNRQVWRPEARKTAAHSTAIVSDTSSSHFIIGGPSDGVIAAGPRKVGVSRHDRVVTSVHDGYRRRFGVTHARTLALADSGDRLDGEDTIEGADVPYVLRFHLHPAVQTVATESGNGVMLVLPNREAWLFAADAPVAIEESVALAVAEGPRRTRQLVLDARSGSTPRIAWTFRRLNRSGNQAASDIEMEPELPL